VFALSASSPTHAPKPDPGPLAHIWDNAPGQIVTVFVVLVALGTLLTAIQPVWDALAFIAKGVGKIFRRHDADEEYRIRQRQGFARFVVTRLEELASKEDWRDDRFAELEAEVEVEGRERVIGWLRLSPYRQVTLRREKSLSKGLARTTDSLVILEGDPGSGKSVALRHLAEQLARKARDTKSATSLIPLYVNLKEFHPLSRPVDGEAVREFIIESLTRTHDRDVELFLDEEFDRGMRDGTWLLLLDSFDEIPDVLSSAESDNAVAEYASAINNFLSGMRTSRAIIASREFRGPVSFRVPRFRIVALTTGQQDDLIKRSGLRPAAQESVHEGIAVADPELRQMARNPMFLGLICEYMRAAGSFPPSSHAAYDAYLEQRLTRDTDRIRQRYGVGPDLVRAVAEETAFCMTNTEGLGLSPARADLRTVLAATGRVSVRLLDKVLDALEYTKLGRAADDPAGTGKTHFTFAHRRFQEYFATRVVLRAPNRVSIGSLLTNGRWRETAVTILQTQPTAATAPLLDEAAQLLGPLVAAADAGGSKADSVADPLGFSWPPGALHLLQLLDAGLGRAPDALPQEIRDGCGRLLRTAWERGRRHDQKWAASVALVADRETTLWLTEQAFRSGSVYLGGAAYTVVSRMTDPPASLYAGVRQTLLNIAASGELKAERVTIKAQISRLPDPAALQRVLRLLAVAPAIDLLLAVLIAVTGAIFNAWTLIPAAIALPLMLRLFPVAVSRSRVRWGPDDKRARPRTRMFPVPGVGFLRFIGCGLLLGGAVRLVGLTDSSSAAGTAAAHTAAAPASAFVGTVLLFLIAYFSVWPSAVAASARDGHVPTPTTWPALPIYAVVHSAGYIAAQMRRNLRNAAEMLAMFVCFTAAVLCVYLLWTHVTASHLILIALGCLLGLMAFAGACLAVSESASEFYEARRLSRKLRQLPAGGEFGADELLGLLASVRSARAATVVLSFACRHDLARSPALAQAISDLGGWAEAEADADVSLGPQVADWVESSSPNALRAVRSVSGMVLDMMARSVERTELARQGQEAPS
jgi:hypothetical protein